MVSFRVRTSAMLKAAAERHFKCAAQAAPTPPMMNDNRKGRPLLDLKLLGSEA